MAPRERNLICNVLPMSRAGQGEDVGLDGVEPRERERLVAFRLLLLVSAQLRARMDRLLAPITTQQAALLSVVTASGRPSFGDVADVLSTSHQNVKQIALVLEREGLLRIVVDEDDRRVRRLEVTAKNRALWAKRDPVDHAEVASWFAPLADEDVTTLVDSLRRVRDGLKRDRDRACGGIPSVTDPSRARAARPLRVGPARLRGGSTRAQASADRATRRA